MAGPARPVPAAAGSPHPRSCAHDGPHGPGCPTWRDIIDYPEGTPAAAGPARDAVVWRDKIAAAIAFAGDDLGPDSGVAEYRAAADAVLAVVGPLLDQAEADRDAARADQEALLTVADNLSIEVEELAADNVALRAQARAIEALCDTGWVFANWYDDDIPDQHAKVVEVGDLRAVLASTPTQPKEQP